jgi:hypothetical protein
MIKHPPLGLGWAFYVWAVLLNGIAFSVVGPFLGAIASPAILGFPFSVIIAYMTTTLAAFATGCIVGVASSWLTPLKLYFLAAAAGAISSATLPFCGLLSWYIGTPPPVLVGLYAFCGVTAALICTRIFRQLRLRPESKYWCEYS